MDYTSFIFGAISGCVGSIMSHPVDTYKTLTQKNNISNSQIPKFYKLSLKQLYSGIKPATASLIFEKAIVLGVYNNMMHYTDSNIIAGGVSGFCSSFSVTIFERLKIIMQVNNAKYNINYKSLLDGLPITLTREVPGFAIYFSVYNYMKNNNKNQDNLFLTNFINGATAGVSSWIFIYPQDNIKTIIQSSIHTKLKISDIAKDIYRNGGIRSFYKGFHLCVIRACLLHGSVLATMEFLSDLLY